jgi:hypothetical protein
MAEPMFDCGTGERPPVSSRELVPTVRVIEARVEISIDECVAALVRNPHFVCHGCRNGAYFFRSKRARDWIITRKFSSVDILKLAPRKFWLELNEGKALSRTEIIDVLIRLAERTGRYLDAYERSLAAGSAARDD